MGDANMDLEFTSSDMVQVFVAGLYETGQTATWAQGDWDGDTVFSSSDFVVAFNDGGYERGLRDDVAAVPEPSAILLISLAIACLLRRARSQ